MSTYRVQKAVLAAEERSLHHALTLIIAQRALLLSKVKLSAIIEPSQQHCNVATATYLDRYLVDFVICERMTTRPLFVIIVDGQASDAHASSVEAAQIEQICRAAALPLVRIAQAEAYRMDKLLRLLDPLLSDGPSASEPDREDALLLSKNRDHFGRRDRENGKSPQPSFPRSNTIFSPN